MLFFYIYYTIIITRFLKWLSKKCSSLRGRMTNDFAVERKVWDVCLAAKLEQYFFCLCALTSIPKYFSWNWQKDFHFWSKSILEIEIKMIQIQNDWDFKWMIEFWAVQVLNLIECPSFFYHRIPKSHLSRTTTKSSNGSFFKRETGPKSGWSSSSNFSPFPQPKDMSAFCWIL